MCVLPAWQLDFPQNVVFYQRPSSHAGKTGFSILIRFFWGLAFARFFYVFFRFSVSGGVQRESVVKQF